MINAEIERMKQEAQRPNEKGFPIWLVISEEGYKAFFTYKAMDKYTATIDECTSIILHVDDAREVSYKI